MPEHGRANVSYNPIIDAQLRWPDWTFALTFVSNGTEYIDIEARKFYLDVRLWGTRWPAAVAHGVAHLDLGHHLLDLDHFHRQHEGQASDLAWHRLDTTGAQS